MSFLLQSLLYRMARHFGLPAFGFGFQCFFEQPNKSFYCGGSVGFLCTMSLGDNTYDPSLVRPRLEPEQYSPLLRIGKAGTVGSVSYTHLTLPTTPYV